MEEKTIWELLIQCLSGLLYLHNKKKIVHRDIKPDNLLLDKNFNLKISDFGVSAIDDILVDDTVKFHNTRIGPPLFVAPEVIEGNYITRNKEGNNWITKQTNEKIPNIYSDDLKRFILNLLKNKEKRPDSEQAFLDALYIYTLKYLKVTSIMSLFFCFNNITSIIDYFNDDEISNKIINDQNNKYIFTKYCIEILNFCNLDYFSYEQMKQSCLLLRYLCDKEKKDTNKSPEISLFNFITYILSHLNKELHNELFFMKETIYECLNCHEVIKYKFDYNCLCELNPEETSRYLKKKDIYINDLLEHFGKKRKYGNSNVFCKNCNEYQFKIYETKVIYTSSPNLILQLKYQKNNFNFIIGEKIDIKNYIRRNDISPTKYQLTGVIFYEYNINTEKVYSSISKNKNNQWIYFNGKVPQYTNFNEIQNHKNIEFLFYSILEEEI